jgi:hypothetical protein
MKKFISSLVIVLVLSLAVFIYWRFYFSYSNGYRSGLLQKFSHKGTIFKTYEGEMVLSSIRSNMNAPIASEKFFFSVHEENVARQLEQLQGQMVSVHYNQTNGILPWRGESAYIVDSVKIEKAPF